MKVPRCFLLPNMQHNKTIWRRDGAVADCSIHFYDGEINVLSVFSTWTSGAHALSGSDTLAGAWRTLACTGIAFCIDRTKQKEVLPSSASLRG